MIFHNDSPTQPVDYCSYLVRFWRDHPQSPWRASAQNVQTGETVRFADTDSLCSYLLHQATDACATFLAESAVDDSAAPQ